MRTPESAPQGAPADGVPLLQVANLAIRSRYYFVVLPLLCALVLGGWAYTRPRSYEARASFVPNGAGSGAGGQLGSLAAQLGMNLVTTQPGQSPAFYGELLQTRDILRDAVETPYAVGGSRATLRQRYQQAGGSSDLNDAIEWLRASLKTEVSPETGVVEVRVRAGAPELAEAVAARLIQLTEDFDQNKRHTQASARRIFAQARLEESRAALHAAEARLTDYVAHNRLYAQSPLQTIEFGKLQQDLLLRQQVFAALSQSYEQARIDEVRDTPVITELETPAGAARPIPRGVVLQVLFGLLLGAVIALVLALLREKARLAAASRSAELDEFRTLRAGMARDLKRVVPWPGRGRG
jgi:uncharacterized protein involved in exopolysaccharide biosynthesis